MFLTGTWSLLLAGCVF